jgi:hypothetical protein
MSLVGITGFQMDYTKLTLDLCKNDPKTYNISLFLALVEKALWGFSYSKIHKPTKKGTKVVYKQIESEEKASEYKAILEKMVEELNKKYDAGLELTTKESEKIEVIKEENQQSEVLPNQISIFEL